MEGDARLHAARLGSPIRGNGPKVGLALPYNPVAVPYFVRIIRGLRIPLAVARAAFLPE
ncbi:hypothetical protein D3C85_1765880 [compost metagenome]